MTAASTWIGAHIKREKTIVATFDELRRHGGNVLQIFVCNPRSGRITAESVQRYVDEAASTELKSYMKTHKLQLWIHSPYTFNLGKPFSADTYWVVAMLKQLELADAIGAKGIITHVGHGNDKSLKEMQKAISYILKQWKGRARLVIESASGMGTELLSDLNDLMKFVRGFRGRLKICIDTAHVWAMGYDPVEAIRMVGKKNIACVHLNRNPRHQGSRVDRHDCGAASDAKLREVVALCRDWGVPCIMESPRDCWKKEIILLRENR